MFEFRISLDAPTASFPIFAGRVAEYGAGVIRANRREPKQRWVWRGKDRHPELVFADISSWVPAFAGMI